MKDKRTTKPVKSTIESQPKEIVKHKSGLNFKLLVPFAIIVLIIITATYKTFSKSNISGSYSTVNSWLLYSSLYVIVGFLGLFLKQKARKVFLINWTIVVILITSTEIIFRKTNRGDILNYSEKNQGVFITDMGYYKNSLNRMKDGEVMYNHSSPNSIYYSNTSEFNDTFQLDQFGLNNCKSCLTNKDGFTILITGDSYTFGIGAPQNLSWPNQLDNLFKKNYQLPVRICNLATPGADPAYMYFIYDKIFRKEYDPDLILVSINNSDVKDIMIRGGMERHLKMDMSLNEPRWLPLYASSLVFRSFMQVFKDIDPYLLIPKDEIPSMVFNSYDKLFALMVGFQNEARVLNKKVVFIFNSDYYDVFNRQAELMDIIQEARYQGMHVIDMNEFFLRNGVNESNYTKYYWPVDHHNTSLGYQIWAESVFSYLISN